MASRFFVLHFTLVQFLNIDFYYALLPFLQVDAMLFFFLSMSWKWIAMDRKDLVKQQKSKKSNKTDVFVSFIWNETWLATSLIRFWKKTNIQELIKKEKKHEETFSISVVIKNWREVVWTSFKKKSEPYVPINIFIVQNSVEFFFSPSLYIPLFFLSFF